MEVFTVERLAGKVLRLYALSAVVYVTLFVLCTLEFGLIGSGMAACFAAALPPLAMAMLISKHMPSDTA